MSKKSRKHKSVPQTRTGIQVPPPKQQKAPIRREWKVPRWLLPSFTGVAALFALGYGWFFYSKHFAAPDLKYRGYNLLFVTIDTLRADHVGAYGYKQVKTPNLDSLAANGFLFRRAISQIPLTLPSHTSIFTGTLPIYHGVRDNGGYFVSPRSLTLAEILKQHGYHTAAFVSAFILDSKWGLDQGFDTYYDDFDVSKADETGVADVQRPGGQTNVEALKWLESVSGPFFAWIHYYDPHDPYEPPEPYRSQYAGHPYDGEIAYADSLLGNLLDLLKKRKLLDHTIVVVTGDHGEGLGQHHELTHALFIYDSTLHVPLILHFPNNSTGNIDQTVEHIDIVPTLLDVLQIPKPSVLQGRSLVPLLKRQKMSETTAFSESPYAEKHYGWSPLFSVTSDKYKFIQAPRPELYNLQDDPLETRNLYSANSALAKTMEERTEELKRKNSPSAEQQMATARIDTESQEMLKALGYIGGGPSEKMKESGKNIDPKDKIQLVENLHAAFRDMQQNQLSAAETKLQNIIKEDPEIVDAYLLQGMIASKRQNYADAATAFQHTLELRPDNLVALNNLAIVYRKTGATDKAIDGFKEVLRRDPHYLQAMINLAQVYAERNQPDEALPYFRQAISRYEEMLRTSNTVESIVSIHDALSGIFFSQGKVDEAEKEIREIIRLKPDYQDAHYNLAQIYEKRRALNDAVEQYQLEIRYNPSNFKAYNDLALLLRQTNHAREAIPVLEQAMKVNAESYGICYLLAESLVETGGDLQEARQLAEKAVSLKQGFRRGYELLSEIYSRLGMQQEADAAKRAAEQT